MSDADLGNLFDPPNKNYEKFFAKFKEIETLPIEQWKVNHLIGYFTKKYKEHYHTNYKFKFNTTAPSSCFEVFQMKKLGNNLSSDPKILKDYIDWVFKTRVASAKKKLTSISFLTVEGIMTEYKVNVYFAPKHNSISRSSLLPDNVTAILGSAGIMAKTYADFAFISQVDPVPDDFRVAFEKVDATGFDRSILGKLA